MDGPVTLVVVAVVLVVWIGVLTGVLLSLCCCTNQPQQRRRERRRSSSSSSDSEGPVPTPPPPPPVIVPNVFGVSPDPQATAIVNNGNSSTTPPFVKQIFGPLSDVPVSPLVNPNYVTATFSGSYNTVLSVSQSYAPGSSPAAPNGGTLDVILPGSTSSVVQRLSTNDASGLPVLLSVASSVSLTGSVAGINQVFVATTDKTDSVVALYVETAIASGTYNNVVGASYGVLGVVQDMRVSPDNTTMVIVTDAQATSNVYLLDITVSPPNTLVFINTQDPMYSDTSPPTSNDLTAVSAAFTPDNAYVLVALTNGTGPDRILRLSATDGSFQGVAFSQIPTSGSPRQVAVKIVCSGGSYIVGRRGVDQLDYGTLNPFGPPPAIVYLASGDNNGIVDLQNAPGAGAGNDAYVALYDSGRSILQVNTALGINEYRISIFSSAPATRVSFFRDGQKCYFSTNTNVTFVWEQDMFSTAPPVQVAGTELNTWYVTGVSSADYSSSF